MTTKQKKPSHLTTLAPITMGTLTATAIMYPVDVVRALRMSSAEGKSKTIPQLIKGFKAQHGWSGFLTQGVGPQLVGVSVLRITKFFCYPIAHEAITGGKKPSEGNLGTRYMAGFLASFPETIAFAPFDIAKLALQLDSEKKYRNNPVAAVKDIYARRGFLGLYTGFAATQARQSVWTGIYLATLDPWKKFVMPATNYLPFSDNVNNTAAQTFSGFAAAVTGALVNTPADVVRTNVQKNFLKDATPAPFKGPASWVVGGVTDCVSMVGTIARTNGVKALWFGIGPKAAYLGGSGALLAVFLPFFRKLLGVEREILG